jgi:hypothetical protein
VVLYGETGKQELSILYDERGGPRFVDRIESGYDAPFGEVVKTQRTRFYFRDGTAIRLVAGDREVIPDDSPRPAEAQQVYALAAQLAMIARRP